MALALILMFGAVSCTSDADPAVAGGPTTASTNGGLEGVTTVGRAPALPLTGTGNFGGGVTAHIERIDPVLGTAGKPGEVGGPAVAVTVQIDNASAMPISLDEVSVSLIDSAGNVSADVSGNSAMPFAGMTVEGGTAQATYVFVVPSDARNPVMVTIGYSPSSPTLVFSGKVAPG